MGATTDAATSFSARLRAATTGDHQQAEGGSFVGDLLGGRLPRDAYAALASQHWFIYDALERAAQRMADDPLAAPFVDPRLHRLAHLEADLAFLLGADWREQLVALPATRRYAGRIEDVAARSAPAFVAHHYTRYLGDLSGGQAIAAGLRRTYGLGAEGTTFYVFADIGSPRDVKARYRELLDDAPFTPAQQQQLVDETREAYACNTAVFADLDAAVGGAQTPSGAATGSGTEPIAGSRPA